MSIFRGLFSIISDNSKLLGHSNSEGGAFSGIKEQLAQGQVTENLLAGAAEKVARENLVGATAKLDPESWDFSAFGRSWQASDFTRGQLLTANLANYKGNQLADDIFMDGAGEGNFPQINLQMLAFAIANKVNYDARDDRLSFNGGALEIDYLEPEKHKTETAGLVRVRAKVNRNVPHMIVNPAMNGVKLTTSNYIAEKLKTEGGNDHFQIFVSPGYERDALYIFTPDVLSVMNQYGSDFAYKFYDTEVEIYAPRIILRDGEQLREMCLLAVNLARQIHQQAVRYRDEYASDHARAHGHLATSGRRMSEKIDPTDLL